MCLALVRATSRLDARISVFVYAIQSRALRASRLSAAEADDVSRDRTRRLAIVHDSQLLDCRIARRRRSVDPRSGSVRRVMGRDEHEYLSPMPLLRNLALPRAGDGGFEAVSANRRWRR